MKLGIFSDVHANHPALERVVELLRELGATGFLCGGDTVGYGPDPVRCLELVRSLRPLAVAGNHDRGAAGLPDPVSFNALAREALAWTIGQLGEEDTRYLESLPLVERADPFQLVHATPSAPESWGYVLSAGEAREELQAVGLPACIVGHSHRPFIVETRDEQVRQLQSGAETRAGSFGQQVFGLEIRPGFRYFINVGSVGQPRDGDPRACCALYDTNTREFGFYRVGYDLSAVQARMRQAGLPEYLAERLAGGR